MRPILLPLLLVVFCLNMGAIRKNDDHVVQTQTDPILYEKKMEEVKDGDKGPSMPVMAIYKKSNFLSQGSVNQEAPVESPKKEAKVAIDELTEELPDDLGGSVSGDASEEDYWWSDGEEPDQNPVKKTPDVDDQMR
jgi:hypothetical protein